MPSSAKTSSVRPLKVRRGARYTCFGDGLCCTDLHGLGPLTRKEVRSLQVISDGVVVPGSESGFEEPMLRTRDDGGCLFLGEGRCDLHAALGAASKPAGCRRFPLGLTATPTGGRITTRHRCPCRTLGDRPPLEARDALPSLTDRRGRPKADRRIGDRIRMARGKRRPFSEYEALEAVMLERLEAGEDPAAVLDAKPFPRLRKTSWKKIAAEMESEGVDHSRFGRALGWFAASIHTLTASKQDAWDDVEPLVWSDAFDRAQDRSRTEAPPADVLADWIADEIWGLEWVERGSFARARADLATRLAIARHLEARLRESGRRPDRAAAEAVAVVDLLGDSEWWEDVVKLIRS